MNRRSFMTAGLGLGALLESPGKFQSALSQAVSESDLNQPDQSRSLHRLPQNDAHYKPVKSYVEDVPIARYHWASERAYEAFRDMKYGVRIHWGIYAIDGVPGASWPLLKMSKQEKQRYEQLYKGWNPRGFDADEW